MESSSGFTSINTDPQTKQQELAKRRQELDRKRVEVEEEKRKLIQQRTRSPIYFNDYKEKNEKELGPSFRVNPDITLELSGCEISCLQSSGEFLFIGCKDGSILQYKVTHRTDRYGKLSCTFDKQRKYIPKKVEKPEIISILLDERADLLFYMDKDREGIYVLSLSTLELQINFQDNSYKWEYFKIGCINLGKKVNCYSLEKEKHMIILQTEDKTFFGFQYANRDINNQILLTPCMELIYEFHLKDNCTSIYFFGEILICHFKGSTRINVYTLKRRRKSKISTKGDDNKYVWDDLEDFPQIIQIQTLGLRKCICLLKTKALIDVIYLDGIEGSISQYSVKETNFFEGRFPSKPISDDVGLSFPYVASICKVGEETHVIFKNLLFEDRKTDDEFRSPSPITNLPNLQYITGCQEMIFAASKNIIYPILPPQKQKAIDYYQKNFFPEKEKIYSGILLHRTKILLEQKRMIANNLFLKEKKSESLNVLYEVLDEVINITEQKDDKIRLKDILQDINNIIATLPDWELVREFALVLYKRKEFANECIFIGKTETFQWNPKLIINLIKEYGTLKSLEKYLKHLIEEERCTIRKIHTIYLETLIKLYLNDSANADLHVQILSIIENSPTYDKETILPILENAGLSYEASLVEALIEQSLLEEKINEENRIEDEKQKEEEDKSDHPEITVTDETENSEVVEKGKDKPRRTIIRAIQRITSKKKIKQEAEAEKNIYELNEEDFDHEMEIFLNEKSIMNENSRKVFHDLSKEKKILIYESWKEEKKKMRTRLKTITEIRLIEKAIPDIKETKFIQEFNDYLNDNGIFDDKIRQTLYLLSMDKKYSLLESYKKEKEKEKKKLEEIKNIQQIMNNTAKKEEKILTEKEEISNEELNRKMNLVADKMGITGDARKKFLDLPKEQKVVIIEQHKKINPNLLKDLEIKDVEAPKIDRDYTGYAVNFLSVFSVRSMKEGFIKHLKLESNAEPFEFLLELNKMSKEISKDSIERFVYICDEFIITKAPREINIFGGDKHRVLKIKHDYVKNNKVWPVKESPSDVLEKIRRTLFNDLRLDTFPRFLASKYGYDCVMQCATNPMVVTKDPLFVITYKLKNSNFLSENLKEEEIVELAQNLSHAHKLKEKYNPFSFLKNVSEKDKKKYKIPIRILLFEEEVEKQVKTRGFKDIISLKFENEKESAPTYFTTALLIGTTVYEWNDQDLCIPREYDPKEVSIVFQIDSELTIPQLESSMNDLLHTIIEWNSSKKYELEGGDKRKFGNSQDFVETCLRALDVKMAFPFYSPCHEDMVRKVKDKGYTKLFFSTTSEFRKKMFLKNNEFTFKTHDKFDEFVYGLLQIDKLLDVNFPGEYVWFKAIDRYFSMKYLKLSNNRISSEKDKTQLPSTPQPEGKPERMDKRKSSQRKSLSLLNFDMFRNKDKEKEQGSSPMDQLIKSEADKVKPSHLCPFKK